MSFQEPLQVWKIDGNDVDDGNVDDSDNSTETFKMTRVLWIQLFSKPVRSWLEWSDRNHPRRMLFQQVHFKVMMGRLYQHDLDLPFKIMPIQWKQAFASFHFGNLNGFLDF